MARLTVPIKVELPDDWQEQILERIKQDDDWVCVIRCKECKHFHYDKPYVVNGIPVLGHEVCDKWGDGCKTSEDGFCFMAELRGEQE